MLPAHPYARTRIHTSTHKRHTYKAYEHTADKTEADTDTHTHTHTHTHTECCQFVYAHVRACVRRARVCVHARACVRACVRVCARVRACVLVRVCVWVCARARQPHVECIRARRASAARARLAGRSGKQKANRAETVAALEVGGDGRLQIVRLVQDAGAQVRQGLQQVGEALPLQNEHRHLLRRRDPHFHAAAFAPSRAAPGIGSIVRRRAARGALRLGRPGGLARKDRRAATTLPPAFRTDDSAAGGAPRHVPCRRASPMPRRGGPAARSPRRGPDPRQGPLEAARARARTLFPSFCHGRQALPHCRDEQRGDERATSRPRHGVAAVTDVMGPLGTGCSKGV